MAHNTERDTDAEARNRATELGYEIVDCGGGGNCVPLSFARICGELPDRFRAEVARIMLQNKDNYRCFGCFENDESWVMYCHNMATPGVFVEGAPFYQAAADYLKRPVFLLSHQNEWDSYFKVDDKAKSSTIWLIFCNHPQEIPTLLCFRIRRPLRWPKGHH